MVVSPKPLLYRSDRGCTHAFRTGELWEVHTERKSEVREKNIKICPQGNTAISRTTAFETTTPIVRAETRPSCHYIQHLFHTRVRG